ncbi:MAG: hypothetical protein ACTH5M_05005 [Psychrobacter sp.]|uniref:hypothetical protein n=1 Tax=Psychrobacter sp. AOP7-B1-24 TaxID=3457645 RepID=UPI003FBA63EF
MKKSLFIAFVSLSTLFVPYSSSIAQSNKVNDLSSIDQMYSSKLVGTWNCEFRDISEDGTIIIEGESSYFSNGRSNDFGTISIEYSKENITLEYYYSGTGTWEIKNKKLFEITEDMKIKNISHPYMDESFNLTDIFPQNMTDSSTIISLSKSSVVLKDDTDGEVYTCSKKIIN